MRPRARRTPTLRDLRAAIVARHGALGSLTERVHTADLASWMSELSDEEAWQVFESLAAVERAQLLEYASDRVRQLLVLRCEIADLTALVEILPPDEVVDLLALVDEEVSEQVLRAVDFERAAGLRELAGYDVDSAGGIMTPEVDIFPEGTRVGDAIRALRKDGEDHAELGPGVFVVDGGDRPVGFVTDRELLTTPIHSLLEEVMDREIVTVHADDDQEHVAQVLSKYSLSAVPVVDDRGSLIGVVTADDALDAFETEAEEDFLKLVGTAPGEQTRLPIRSRVRQRLPLMGLTVVGGLASAKILALAGAGGGEGITSGDVLRYVPTILGLAGNVGIQSSTIIVRGFATGEVRADRELSVFGSEVATGATIGLVCGLATALVATFSEAASGELALAFASAIGIGIAIAVTWAAALGCVVPMACHRIGVDPAVVAGPFLITMSDVSGTAIFVAVVQALVN
ncbi:magnesium transporter [Engelhardtia mirabilis]|uniref:Magnesium transporter MgtE n=1 Tax=Engelhardtia mirabilis TaxID=2528011 RepID=A0A518BDC4_9BACT|nr:Magnesium transporter MgtE [Planctomycetes bacterium Pla133]QDU99300.1 Magnesium transporter MgtE [Planctomycetes bacterium Pla86]